MPEQHLEALQRANDVRLHRAKTKRDLAAGRTTLAAVLETDDERLFGQKVRELLLALPRFGPTKTDAVMAAFHLRHSVTVERLSPTTRRRLLAALVEDRERAQRQRAQRQARKARARARATRAQRVAA